MEAEKVPVGGDIVETVIVHAEVGNMWGHGLYGLAAADLEELLVTRGVELQDGRAVDETLRPFRPSASDVFSIHRKDGRALGLVIIVLERKNFFRRDGVQT